MEECLVYQLGVFRLLGSDIRLDKEDKSCAAGIVVASYRRQFPQQPYGWLTLQDSINDFCSSFAAPLLGQV